jgi:site-specific DNA-cytosine methylase
MSVTFIDLFAGIGGFHAALSAMGGECVYASEIDTAAAKIYEQNWGLTPAGDITLDANDDVMNAIGNLIDGGLMIIKRYLLNINNELNRRQL